MVCKKIISKITESENGDLKKKEEFLQNINEMLETLPLSEIIRIHSYLSELYFS